MSHLQLFEEMVNDIQGESAYTCPELKVFSDVNDSHGMRNFLSTDTQKKLKSGKFSDVDASIHPDVDASIHPDVDASIHPDVDASISPN